MATLFSSGTWVLLGLVLEMTSSILVCSSLRYFINSISCPPILWLSWSPMTIIKDEFFFKVTLGITCRIKRVVATLRGLWPRGMFWLMELMFSLVGLLGFPLIPSSFGLLNFKTSPSSVFFILLRYLSFTFSEKLAFHPF